MQWINLHPVDSLIGSLHGLIMLSTFGKHENSAFWKNFISTSWKSILKLVNLRIFSPIQGAKENHFYSLPFGQAEASIY